MSKNRKELYQFKHGNNVWYFTSSSKAVVHNDITYRPIRGLSRSDIEDAGIDKSEFEITFPQIKLLNVDQMDLLALFINKIFMNSVYVEIIELNNNQSLVLFRGRVTVPSFNEEQKTLSLTVSSDETYQHRNILTRKFQRSCPNKIYDRFCGLNFEKWSSKAVVMNISGLTVDVAFSPSITIDESIDVYGNSVKTTTTINSSISSNIVSKSETILIETTDKDTGEITTTTEINEIFSREDIQPYSRGLIIKDGIEVYIVNSNGLSLGLYRQFPNLKVGDIVYIAMGCNQSFESCKTFKNNSRFMGFPFMPSSNPVNDQIIK
ncbi:DUF2163 domain-containing protein [Acinetobacter sp. WCHAc060033]|uniref:phage BR0599 family protein n=1 Tax=Acinetobacter sp. WCHAc060033 TaxID=2518624 RepID=UPI001023A407|nr:phage BR0599 family protein [Acinetobacter sp. WCHAc060033]RZG78691.1 DUF2163 domain-containing protein [Acinetobacter sp. WCHAc060033]